MIFVCQLCLGSSKILSSSAKIETTSDIVRSMTSRIGPSVFSIIILVAVLMLQLVEHCSADNGTTNGCDDLASNTPTRFPIILGWIRRISHTDVNVRLLLVALTVLLVAALIAALVARRLCRLLLMPLDRVKLLGDVGYIRDGRQSMKDVIEQVRRRRAIGDVPPVYPNGWFALVESRCLSVGEVKNIFCVGKT